MTLVSMASGERNEALNAALQMESATRTLVDNLIAELSELRRENADITMKAELLANEVTRLSKAEKATDVVKQRRELQSQSTQLTPCKELKEADNNDKKEKVCTQYASVLKNEKWKVRVEGCFETGGIKRMEDLTCWVGKILEFECQAQKDFKDVCSS